MATKEIVSVVIAGIVGVVWAVIELRRWRKDRRARKVEEEHALAPNPTRCADHESRLRNVEVVCTQYKTGHEDLVNRVNNVAADVKTLINLHMKP